METACAKDEAKSCFKLGSIYLSTKMDAKTTSTDTPTSQAVEITRDAKIAQQYLERACNHNYAPACHNLAVMYKNGDSNVKRLVMAAHAKCLCE